MFLLLGLWPLYFVKLKNLHRYSFFNNKKLVSAGGGGSPKNWGYDMSPFHSAPCSSDLTEFANQLCRFWLLFRIIPMSVKTAHSQPTVVMTARVQPTVSPRSAHARYKTKKSGFEGTKGKIAMAQT